MPSTSRTAAWWRRAASPRMPGRLSRKALLKYMKTEIFKKYVAENMLSEAWMDGPTFGKWMEGVRPLRGAC